ncbi:hypothetical protein GGI20_005939 [Coemansia sp. BCRC 34301]|nr:hypothetical protein GGI20_005939 [Coemansia sp. BCRC 34301]
MTTGSFFNALRSAVRIERPRINAQVVLNKKLVLDVLLLMVGGVCTLLQGVVNGSLSTHVSGSFASWLSFGVGSLLLGIFFLLDSRGGRSIDWKNAAKTAPWWAWLGGVPGAAFVLIITLLIPYRGAAVVSGITICSQMVVSLFVDSFALFGCVHRPATILRLLGIGLMVTGVLMVALG